MTLLSQNLPAGTPVLEDYYRREQLLGRVDSFVSLMIRPLAISALKVGDIFDPENMDSAKVRGEKDASAKSKVKFQLLPLLWQQQYNTKRPHGWNDEAMIPAKGYQTLISGGFFAKYGPLSIQFKPEFLYARNLSFTEYPRSYNEGYELSIDLPMRFGTRPYSKFFLGQSNVSLQVGPVGAGVSSESLWWGPGIRNSLLMSNNAPGFAHIFLKSVDPVKTGIGSFEFNLIAGRLEGSHQTVKPTKWRYLSSVILNYQPKYVKGLSAGIIRSFQIYDDYIKKGADYFPVFQSLNPINNVNESIPWDQLASIFMRWVWTGANVEIYGEYGRGDYSATKRDLILEPDHSRAYLFGFQKLIKIEEMKNNDAYWVLAYEGTHLRQSDNYYLRTSGSWYTHAPIINGYTNRGQVLGAGIGPGGNMQSFRLGYAKGLKHIDLQLEWYSHADDFYPPSPTEPEKIWRESSTSLNIGFDFKKVLLQSKFDLLSNKGNFTNSGSMSGVAYKSGNDISFQSRLELQYRF